MVVIEKRPVHWRFNASVRPQAHWEVNRSKPISTVCRPQQSLSRNSPPPKSCSVNPTKALSRSASTPTLYTGVTPGCETTLRAGRQQSALARSTAECRRRGYDVRGLIHAGRFTTVQLVSRPSVRAFNDDGEPVWRTDTDPREVDETDKMWVVKTTERARMPRGQRINADDGMHAHASVSSHPNVCKLMQFFETPTDFFLVTECCTGGDLLRLINLCSRAVTGGGVPHDYVPLLFRQLVNAVLYCHDKGVIHRDLKCENILLDSCYNVKLSGFHYAFAASRAEEKFVPMRDIRGTYAYSAPEVQFNRPGAPYNGRLADVWSVGVILFALLNGTLPFGNNRDQGSANQLMRAHCIIFTRDVPQPAYAMTLHLLTYQPQGRPRLRDIVDCPWLTISQNSTMLGSLGEMLYCSKPMSRDNNLFMEADPAWVPEAVPIETQEEPQTQEQLGQRQAKGDRLSSSNVECSSHRQRALKLLKAGVPASPSRFFGEHSTQCPHDYDEEMKLKYEAPATTYQYMSMCSHQHLHERESSQRAKVSSSAVLAVPLVPSNTPCTSPRVSSPLLGYTATRATSPSHGNHVMRALGYKWDFDGRKPWSTLPPPATTPSVLLTNDVLVPPRDPVSGGCINRPTPSQVVVQVAGRDGGDDARSPHPARRSGLPFGQRRWNNVLAEMSIKSGAVADCRRKAQLPSVAIGYVAYRPPVYRCRYISGQRSN